ncbi:hypothetical protein D922_03411 [Enterococcus faecalis 06-MB-DW-09]|nr:hypothetical protein D922_03411 [Enterococcus faecalis 06-MB-DW-09]
MRIPEKEKKINQLLELVDGLSYSQFKLLVHQAEVHYENKRRQVQLDERGRELLRENCIREFTE